MPLYWRTFLDDVQHLTPELLGGYVLLLGHQWKEGAIPAETMLQAPIAKLSLPKTRLLMRALGDRFSPHPSRRDELANAFMERVRAEQRAKFEANSARGKKAVAARRDRTPSTTPSSTPSTTPSNADIENRDQDRLASLADPGAGARAKGSLTDSPAYVFCLWMLREGIERGAIPAHNGADEFAWCYRHLTDAQSLLDTYGDPESRIRAERFMAGKVQRRIRRDLTPKALLDAWDWEEIRGTFDLHAKPAFESQTEWE